jgi:hypothetical protein
MPKSTRKGKRSRSKKAPAIVPELGRGYSCVTRGSGLNPDVWVETQTGKRAMVWRLQGGALTTAADGALPMESALSLVKPYKLSMSRRWWRVFAVLPTLADRFVTRDGWTRLGWVNLYQYQSGMRTSLQVWRNENGDFVARNPIWARHIVWLQGSVPELGAWCATLWQEAFLRCREAALAAGVPEESAWRALNYLGPQQSPRWYHRAWREPRHGRLLGPNGWGEEIDSAERAAKLAASRGRRWVGDGRIEEQKRPVRGADGSGDVPEHLCPGGAQADREPAAGSVASDDAVQGEASRPVDESVDHRLGAGDRRAGGEVDAGLVEAAFGADGVDENAG